MKLTNLNELRQPTWRWLNINAAELALDIDVNIPYNKKVICSNAKNIRLEHYAILPPADGLPADINRMRLFVSVHRNYALTITIPGNVHLEQPVVLDFVLDEQAPVLIDLIHIRAEAGSRADIVINYRSGGSASCFHSGFSYVEAAPNAAVRLIKIQMLGEDDVHLDTTAVQAADHASGNMLYCELGGKQVLSSCNLALSGTAARGSLDSLYLGSGSRRQDFNYRLELKGSGSEGDISVKGALTGTAKKVLKSTLDFISGASGSKGREAETVLTLSDRVVNVSAPLLLCGEDNVEGEHATSTGKPDEGKLYYLMSRGFTEKEAKRLLVEAAFAPILDKIPCDRLCEDISARIREVIDDET